MNKTKGSGISRRLSRRIFGLLLSIVLILGIMPNTTFSVYAEEAVDTYNMETTEDLSTDTDATPVVETTSDEADADKTDENEVEQITGVDPVAAGDDTGKFKIFVGIDPERGEDIGNIDVAGTEYEGQNILKDHPYWKNDPDNPGKLMPTTQEANDYNLWYEPYDPDDPTSPTLHLKDINLSVTVPDSGEDDWDNAIYACGYNLTINLEGTNTIVCKNGIALQADCSLEFVGDGSLTLKAENEYGFPALSALGNITYEKTAGSITLDPANIWLDGAVLGDGNWIGMPSWVFEEYWEDGPWKDRDNYQDGVPHLGYSGCYLTKEEFEKYGGIQWNGLFVDEPLYWVHGSSVQEVIDKLSGDIPVRVTNTLNKEDTEVTGGRIKTDYIFVTTSGTNYYLETHKNTEEYITSTRDFKGIVFFGSAEIPKTNHPYEPDGTWEEDFIYKYGGSFQDLYKTMQKEGIEKVQGIDMPKYISTYHGDLYEAIPVTPTADKQWAYDLGARIITADDLWAACEEYNEKHKDEPGFEPIKDIDEIMGLLSEWSPALDTSIRMPLPTLHINSQCDFVIGGDFGNIQQPKNKQGINVYFGFLPDTNHKISIIYYNNGSDKSGKTPRTILDEQGNPDQNRHITDYDKTDLQNGAIRGTMKVSTSIVKREANGGFVPGNLNILMYEHITEEGTVSGDYPGAVTMDMASIPNGRILENIDITAAQLDVLETGDAVNIDLAVNELDTSAAANQAAVTDIAGVATKGGYADPFYMDLNLSASIRNASGNKLAFANGATDITLTELEEPIELTVEIPNEMQSTNESREYAIVRRHVTPAGQVQTELLSAKYDAKTKSLTFETDKFSTYAIVYKEASLPVVTPGANTTTPKTGDNAPIAMAVVLLCSSMGFMVLVSKKRKIK